MVSSIRALFVITLLLILNGCYTPITDLNNRIPEDDIALIPDELGLATSDVLAWYLSQGAYEAVADIPLVDGLAPSGFAVGVNIWSRLASLITLSGWSKKVVFPEELLLMWGAKGLLHEYVHHLDAMDRDGVAEFIDHDAFVAAYTRMYNDFTYGGIAIWTERQVMSQYRLVDFFGVGDLAEHIAYCASYIAFTGKGPTYMKRVLEGMFSRDALYR